MRQRKIFKQLILSFLFAISISVVKSQETVTFDTTNLMDGGIEKGAAGMVTCWLVDSDMHRPRTTTNEERWAEMEVGSIRYPFGHLANNHLWDTPPYGSSPLTPRPAVYNKSPGGSPWAVDSNGYFTGTMDFDEFMGICQRQNIKPLVVVNALAWKYSGGPSYEELKTAAVEWVKYAKNMNYDVSYWQIGNEMDHHWDIITQQEYVDLYQDFVTAMKAEDPTIICGTGLLHRTGYLSDILNQAPDLVDFASVHQYLFGNSIKNYTDWVNHNGADLNSNVRKNQNTINASSKPDLPILITETNAFGNWEDGLSSLYKGLAWFDMLFTQQQYEDVKYTYMWSSHGLSENIVGAESIAHALSTDMKNELKSTGWPLKILNTTAEDKIMFSDNKVHGTTYSYGTYTPNTGKSTIYLLNKASSSQSMTVNINNYEASTTYERWVFTGTSPDDERPTYIKSGSITLTNNGFTTTLPPYSLVVVKLSDKTTLSVSNTEIKTSEVLIYPNSLKKGEDFNLNYNSNFNNSKLKIRIIDMLGKTVLIKEKNVYSGLNKLKISSTGLSQGLFFVEISSGDFKNVKKLIVN